MSPVRKRVFIASLFVASTSACSGGGSSGPSILPTAAARTPTPVAGDPSPTPTPTGSAPTATPSSQPTGTPHATPTPSAVPTPSPSPTPWELPAFDPGNIASYGYDLVFDAEWNDTSDVNTSATPVSGAKFYTRLFDKWGGSSNAPSLSVSGGVLTIGGGQISSIAPAASGTGFIGTSFQGGGYFEARLAWNRSGDVYNPSKGISDDNWWPSFYSVPAEYFTGSQWPGQAAGYTHFVENDWFEAWSGNYYGATVHDWWGQYSSAGCSGISTPLGYCEISNDGTSTVHPTDPALDGVAKNQNRVSMGTSNPAGFHIIGALWVSAKHSRDGVGYVEYFFDNVYTGVWKAWQPLPSGALPPPSLPYIFSELDDNHSVIFIGAPSNQVLQVDWIHAWQLEQSIDPESNPPVTPESGFTGP